MLKILQAFFREKIASISNDIVIAKIVINTKLEKYIYKAKMERYKKKLFEYNEKYFQIYATI